MGLNSRMDLAEKILQVHMELEDAEKEMGMISDRIREFEKIHDKYEQLYGNRFGINRRRMSRRLEGTELDRMMHLVRAENSQPQKTGFLGIGGMKREEYDTLTDKLNLVVSNLYGMNEDWNRYIQEKTDAVREQFENYEKDYRKELSDYQEAVGMQNADSPVEEKKAGICLGNLNLEMPESEWLRSAFTQNGMSTITAEKIHLLLIQDMDQPSACFAFFEKREEWEELTCLVRNLMKQIMCNLPLYRYEFYYLDGMNNCRGLREMLDLQNIQDADADRIAPQLCANGFQMLRVGRDKEGIHRILTELEKYMGKVADLLRGRFSFAEYNRINDEKIPYKFVVLEGIEIYTEFNLIKKLMLNGSQCGMFVLVLQDKADLTPKNLYGVQKADRMDLPDNMPQISFQEGKSFFSFGEKEKKNVFYPITLWGERNDYSDYVSAWGRKNRSRVVDNSFNVCFPENYEYGRYTSTVETGIGNPEGKIRIPFAVDRRGKVTSIELGSANYAHGLISGNTGSGKSTMLHMLINSVVMNYHPDDVEIWLADYKKVEFSVYIAHRPPHIRFIGIERNEEFTFSLLDRITQEYERRLELFKQENVRNIDIYKKKYGMGSLSRILLIIDEFHLMSQQVRENEIYSRKLENLLAEGRGAGIVCLFADQAVSKGLNGLTQKGKDQMRMRLAMLNTKAEMEETLDARGLSDADVALDKGEVRIKRIKIRRNPDGTEERIPSLDLEKVIYISDENRQMIAEKAARIYGQGKEAFIVDGNKPAVFDDVEAGEYEKKRDDGRSVCYLHLGKPSNFEKCFAIPITRNYGNSVACIIDNFDLQRRLLLNAVKSFLRREERRVYVFADDNDAFFSRIRQKLNEMRQTNDCLHVSSDNRRICESILDLHREMVERRSRQQKEDILIFWLGLENMLKDFAPIEKEREEKSSGGNSFEDRLQDRLEDRFSDLFGNDSLYKKEERQLFDPKDKLQELVSEGGKRGIYQFVFFSSALSIKMAKEIKLENFKFKISGFQDKDSCYDFFGSAKFMEGMGENPGDMLVCHDGVRGRFFLPYLAD